MIWRSVSSLAHECRIVEQTIYKKEKVYTPDSEIKKATDLQQIEKEIHRLKMENNSLKNYHHIHERITGDSLLHELIVEESQEHTVWTLTNVFETTKSSYYASKDRHSIKKIRK